LAEVGSAVALLQLAGGERTETCTAFLVRRELLVTAAHCLRDLVSAEAPVDWQHTACRRIGVLFDYRVADRNDQGSRALHCTEVLLLNKEAHPVQPTEGPQGTVDTADIAILQLDNTQTHRSDGSTRGPLSLSPDQSDGVASIVRLSNTRGEKCKE
jgi:hypothetical protein